MNLKVTGAKLVNQITAERKRSTSSVNQTHPDTKGWVLELRPDGLLCTMRNGQMKLIPLSNILELEVEYCEGACSEIPVKKTKAKAKTKAK